MINLVAQRFEAAAIFVETKYLLAREQYQQGFDALFSQLQRVLLLWDRAGGKTADIVIGSHMECPRTVGRNHSGVSGRSLASQFNVRRA